MADKSKIERTGERPKHWGLRLDAFRKRYELSNYALASLTGNRISRSTFQRLCIGQHQKADGMVRHIVAEYLRRFLIERGVTPFQTEKEVCEVVCDDNNQKEESQPVLTQRTSLPKPAQVFFGLKRDPFTGDPRHRSEVFTTPQMDRIAAQLEDAVNYQNFVCLIGDIGAGKSMQKRRLVQTCLDSNEKMRVLWPEFFNMERVHAGSISSFVLREFGQRAPSDLVARAGRMKTLLASLSEEGVSVALGFDECHRLHPNLLTALKNFWELGSGGYDRYLGLVLFGQPRFELTLRQPEFREITERLDIIRMPTLAKRDDAWNYITHRVKIAGGNAEKLFDKSSIESLSSIAATPLALGNLANAALLKAHELNEKKVVKGILTAAGLVEDRDEPGVRGIRKRA